MIIHNLEQQSEEWFEVRKGKMTASHAQAISAAGKGLETYCMDIIAQKYCLERVDRFNSPDTERGNELEPLARQEYEKRMKCDVVEVGFIEYDEATGCSPDGLIEDDGLIEIKCPNDLKYTTLFLTDKIDTKYVWQMQMQMLLTGRKWCDFVAYNPNFAEVMYVQRVEFDEKKAEKLKAGLEKGKELIKQFNEKTLNYLLK